MNWGFILILFVTVVYISNVLGCFVLCETIPELGPARKHVWYVPIIIIVLPVFVIFMSDSGIKDRFELVWEFIKMPHKSITAIFSVIDVLEDQKIKEKRYDPFHKKSRRHSQRSNVFAGSVAHYGTAILTSWLG